MFRHTAARLGLAVLLALAGSAAIAAPPKAKDDLKAEDVEQMLEMMRGALNERKRLLEGDQSLTAPIETLKIESIVPPAEGTRLARMTDFIRRMHRLNQANELAYVQRMNAIPTEQLLAPESLATTAGTLESLRHLAAVSEIVDEMTAYNIRFRAHLRKQMADIWEGDADGAMMLARFNEGMREQGAYLDRMLAIKREIVTTAREILTFMEARRGSFEVGPEGQILFESDIDVLDYNAMLGKIEAAAKREEALLSAVQSGLSEQIEVIEDLQETIDGTKPPPRP